MLETLGFLAIPEIVAEAAFPIPKAPPNAAIPKTIEPPITEQAVIVVYEPSSSLSAPKAKPTNANIRKNSFFI